MMLEHLIHEPPVLPNPRSGFIPYEKASPNDIIDGQVGTSNWLEEMGAPDTQAILDEQLRQASREVFTERITGQDIATQKAHLLALTVPAAVRHQVSMLSQYDWEFVQQAKELRGYVVSKLVEATETTSLRDRLRALEMLGKVTEVGLFTERVEITKVDMTDEALEARIKAKLDKFRHVIDVTSVIEQEPEIVSTNQ